MTFDPDAIEQRQRERRAELPLLPSAIDPVAITWARAWQAEAADLTTALVAYRELEAELQEGVPQYRIALEVEQERNAELEAENERLRGNPTEGPGIQVNYGGIGGGVGGVSLADMKTAARWVLDEVERMEYEEPPWLIGDDIDRDVSLARMLKSAAELAEQATAQAAQLAEAAERYLNDTPYTADPDYEEPSRIELRERVADYHRTQQESGR